MAEIDGLLKVRRERSRLGDERRMIARNRAGLMREQPPVTITRSALREAGVERTSALAAAIVPAGHLALGLREAWSMV